MSITQLQHKIFWELETTPYPECVDDRHVDVAIVGGGITGLSTAQAFAKRGKKVVLLEKDLCGSGATGKSGGFITPNAELSLSDFADHTDLQSAQTIWSFINRGVDTIRSNIDEHNFECHVKDHPGLFVANCKRTLNNLKQEHDNLIKLGYESDFYDNNSIKSVIHSDAYVGGMTYNNAFGLDPYRYCLQMKQHLTKQGVDIFEQTPVQTINDHTIITHKAKITADYIVVCVDKHAPELGILEDNIFHVQNHVLVSEPLTNDQINHIFAHKPYMVWDTQLIYNYYRLIQDNRLLIGGGDIFSAYRQAQHNYTYGRNKLINYLRNVFPDIAFNFTYQWPGLIGVSKDIGPIAEPDIKYPHIYYIAGTAGLPIGTTLGAYSAEKLLDGRNDMDIYFKADRKYFINKTMQKILGKRLSFAISNFMSQGTVGCF